jgi:hypothetical protein
MNRYGWIGEAPGPTEEKFNDYYKTSPATLPKEFSIEVGTTYDQGTIGSCTSSAALTAYETIKKKV